MHRFVFETWKDIKVLTKSQHEVLKGDFFASMRENYIENMARILRTRELDGFDRERFQRTQNLSKFFQKHLEGSQNPTSCQNAKYLVNCDHFYLND